MPLSVQSGFRCMLVGRSWWLVDLFWVLNWHLLFILLGLGSCIQLLESNQVFCGSVIVCHQNVDKVFLFVHNLIPKKRNTVPSKGRKSIQESMLSWLNLSFLKSSFHQENFIKRKIVGKFHLTVFASIYTTFSVWKLCFAFSMQIASECSGNTTLLKMLKL